MAKTKIPSISGISKKERTDAWLAASRFKAMQPQLTAFARSVTGNGKVQVHATHLGPHSVGNKIFIRPPVALGRDYPHDRSVCGMRGDDGRQACSACRVREVVDFYLYHEIGHIWCGTQDQVTTSDRNLFETLIQMWHPEDACSHGPRLLYQAKKHEEVIALANIFSRWLGMIFNALEDSRVNEGMFDARPGLRRTFEVNIDRMMSEGMDAADTGQADTWHDSPADAQFVVGLATLAADYLPDSYFHPDIVEALSDPRVIDITSRARYASSVHEVFELAVRALFVANAMGFCIIPKCEVPPLNDGSEDPDAGTESGQSAESGGSSSPSSNGRSDGNSTGDPTDGSPDADNGSNDPEGSPEKDELSGGTETKAPGTEGAPEGDDNSEGSRPDDNGTDTDGPGASPESDSADDAEANSTDTDGSKGIDREENPPGQEGGADESQPGGSASGGSGQSEEQAGSPMSQGAQSATSGGNSPDEERDDSASKSGTGDPDSDGDGVEPATAEDSDGEDVAEDGDADGQVGPDPQDDNADPWSIAAPEETGSDDDPALMHGTIEDAERALAPFLMHGTDEFDGMLEDMLGEELENALADVEEGTQDFVHGQPIIKVAISQVAYFDDPSASVAGFETITFPCEQIDWVPGEEFSDYSPSEMHIGAAVLHARRVFQENRLSKLDRNQRSGKINTRVLARRAPVGDDRLFGKKTRPKKRDYLVIISGDCSGSTNSFGRSEKIRRMMMAQGDILHRVGVPFIMMGHSAARAQMKNFSGFGSGDYWGYALMIKDLNEGWGPITKSRLAALGPVAENLDGHTLEYCRKLADKHNATDVIIIYYTDGEMPAANATEEREVLVREIKTCKRKGYHLLAVGINTSSPVRYGMKTVRVDSDEDIKLVVEQLEKELTA